MRSRGTGAFSDVSGLRGAFWSAAVFCRSETLANDLARRLVGLRRASLGDPVRKQPEPIVMIRPLIKPMNSPEPYCDFDSVYEGILFAPRVLSVLSD